MNNAVGGTEGERPPHEFINPSVIDLGPMPTVHPATPHKRYICTECFQGFKRMSDLTRHCNDVHKLGQFNCLFETCKRHSNPFSRRANWISHMRTVHEYSGDLSTLEGPTPSSSAEQQLYASLSTLGGPTPSSSAEQQPYASSESFSQGARNDHSASMPIDGAASATSASESVSTRTRSHTAKLSDREILEMEADIAKISNELDECMREMAEHSQRLAVLNALVDEKSEQREQKRRKLRAAYPE